MSNHTDMSRMSAVDSVPDFRNCTHGGEMDNSSERISRLARRDAPTGSAGEAARGSFVSTVGRDERVIREYIRKPEEADTRLDQLGFWR